MENSVKLDGKKIANILGEKLKEKFLLLEKKVNVALVYVGDDSAIDSFIRIKKSFADKIGVNLVEFRFDENIPQEDLLSEIDILNKTLDISGDLFYSGIIVQLPLPGNFNKELIINRVRSNADIDVLSTSGKELFHSIGAFEPIVGAIKTLIKEYKISIANKKISVVGQGILVGKPIISYLRAIGFSPSIMNEDSGLNVDVLLDSDIIISGVGKSKLITGEMVKEGVVIFDAGTSQWGGCLSGDVDESAIKKSSFYSPVPGGIGPLTVYSLFQNLYTVVLYNSEQN